MCCCAPYAAWRCNTQITKATCGTIRFKLLKVGALVRTSVRRIPFAIASSETRPATRRCPPSVGP
jgi:hypothetical protein